jgi:hypothetical protein
VARSDVRVYAARALPAERLTVLPLLVVAVALLRISPMVPLAIACLVATIAAYPLAARFTVTRNEQAFLGVGALAIGILVPRVFGSGAPVAGGVPDGMYALGVAAQLAALVRAFLRAPVGGAPATCAIGLVAMAAAGRASAPFGYPAFVALYLATSAFAVARSDAGRPRAAALGARHLLGATIVVAIAASAVALAATKLPPLHAVMMQGLLRGLGDRTGFSNTLSLGDMRGMTQSSDVVARVRGADVDHLRAVVLHVYAQGQWDVGDANRHQLLELETPKPVGPDAVELELMKRPVPSPLGATDLWSSTGFLEVDRRGILYGIPQHRPKRVAFRVTPGGPAPGNVTDGRFETDGSVPRPILRPLRAVLERWGALGKPPREVAAIIEQRLKTDYAYSLEFTRTRRVDPVLDFLEIQRRGHCEYFASAAALLARAGGVPARVVGGYVVTERSGFGYAIVRERDAHAWAEVQIDGKWQTLDATPGAIGAVPETPWTGSLIDYLQTSWERVDDWLAERSQLELSLALVGLLFVLVFVRWWRNRTVKKPALERVEAPLEAFTELTRALEKAGVEPRDAAEPVEAFARRVASPTLRD